MESTVRDKAYQFVKDFENAGYEKGESQTFWGHFFEVFGISVRQKNILFEPRVGDGYIDAFWPGMILVEQKSEGLNLDAAFKQAWQYLEKLPTKDHPKMIVVSDFKVFRLYSMDTAEDPVEFPLSELPYNLDRFAFLTDGSELNLSKEQDPVSIKAAQLMAKLHEQLAPQYENDPHSLKILLVRIMFLFFADDTEIIRGKAFLNRYISQYTRPDGGAVGSELTTIFKLANTPEQSRPQHIREHPEYSHIPYINGKLYEETIQEPFFNEKARDIFLQCADYNWRDVSPTIFGSMFQAVMAPDVQRALGAHYTAENNILKVLKPLFIDTYWENFRNSFNSPQNLGKLLKRIKNTGVFDPACGCGNFLVVAYRELREIELAAWKRLRELQGAKDQALDIDLAFDGINVDNMYGIEIEDFPSQIAQAALWLEDHLMNMRLSETFGEYYARIPLTTSPNIIQGNALRIDWEDIAPKEKILYIASNPPFVDRKNRSASQRADMDRVFTNWKFKYGNLDYVSCWYIKSTRFIKNTNIKVALVSTNSITQGEHVPPLWEPLINDLGVKLNFAYRSFRWTSDVKKAAALYVVIIGFSLKHSKNKLLFEFSNPSNLLPEKREVTSINPYLNDGPTVIPKPYKTALFAPSPLKYGNIAIDKGNLELTEEEVNQLKNKPWFETVIRNYGGGDELLYNTWRKCIWLPEPDREVLKNSIIKQHITSVKEFRSTSNRSATKALADMPYRFGEIRQPSSRYLMIPKVTSEYRKYVPLGYLDENYIANGSSLIVPDATIFMFGILHSMMHLTWLSTIGGRMEGRYQYSTFVYNNFPWPQNVEDAKRKKVESFAQNVLNERKPHLDAGATLADLYDPIAMPSDLLKAHHELDKAVDKCYRDKSFESERDRLKMLFKIYAGKGEPLTD